MLKEETTLRRDTVKKKALKIRTEFFDSDYSPSNAFGKIFNKYDGKVEYVESNDREETLWVYPNGEFVIFLPLGSSVARDNFTIAHELGHYFLHRVDETSDVLRFTRRGSNRREWEANWFAAELLMPEIEFTKEAKKNNNEYYLAQKFGVSTSAVSVRMSSLNLD